MDDNYYDILLALFATVCSEYFFSEYFSKEFWILFYACLEIGVHWWNINYDPTSPVFYFFNRIMVFSINLTMLLIKIIGPLQFFYFWDFFFGLLVSGSLFNVVKALFMFNISFIGWLFEWEPFNWPLSPEAYLARKEQLFIKKMIADALFIISFFSRFFEVVLFPIFVFLLALFIKFLIIFLVLLIFSDRKSRIILVDGFFKLNFFFNLKKKRKSIFLALLDILFFKKNNIEISYGRYILFLFLLCLNIYIFLFFAQSVYMFVDLKSRGKL
jgi:hypothetical protein